MTRRAKGTGGITKAGYVHIQTAGVFKYEHIMVAERAVGRALPSGAIVHHMDENTQNNAAKNLVVCPDAKYHRLLHRRAAAYDACGNASFIICRHCRKYDDPAVMKLNGSRSMSHPECRSTYRRAVYKRTRRN